jgi:hypothetical protein
MSAKGFFDLGGELEGEGVQTLCQITNILQKIVIGDEGRDGSKEASRCGDEGFRNTRSNGAQAGRAGGAEAGKRVDDAPHGAEQADKGRDASGRCKPRHAFFRATHFFGRCELHAYGDRLDAFHLLWRRRSGIGDLALQFAVAGGVDIGKGRAGGDESLGICDTLCGAKDSQELIALARNASEQTQFLKNEGPGDQREE